MVQRVHFAYDDEELPNHWGIVGGCFPLDEEDEDWEDDLFEPMEIDQAPDFDSPDDFIDDKQNRNHQPEQKRSSLSGSTDSLRTDSPVPPHTRPGRNIRY